MVRGGEFGGLQGTLEAREGTAADGTVGVFALHAKAGEYGGPVGYPGFGSFEVRLLDQRGYTSGELIDEVYSLLATLYLFAFPTRVVSTPQKCVEFAGLALEGCAPETAVSSRSTRAAVGMQQPRHQHWQSC